MPETARARSSLEQQALDYRNRAEQLRVVGEGTKRPGARRILLELADDADRLAAGIEERLKAWGAP